MAATGEKPKGAGTPHTRLIRLDNYIDFECLRLKVFQITKFIFYFSLKKYFPSFKIFLMLLLFLLKAYYYIGSS